MDREMDTSTEPSGSPSRSQLPDSILPLVMLLLPEPSDLGAAACVCRSWKEAAESPLQLRPWTYDDDVDLRAGTLVSLAPMPPATTPPAQWVDPTKHSPFSAFKTPSSLQPLIYPGDNAVGADWETPTLPSRRNPDGGGDIFKTPKTLEIKVEKDTLKSDRGSSGKLAFIGEPSPRTPSPAQVGRPKVAFDKLIASAMLMGRFIGEIDIRSSRLDNAGLQLMFRSCPRLQILRLQHICAGRYSSVGGYHCMQRVESSSPSSSDTPPRCFCGCSTLTELGFLNVASLCPTLTSVTLLLQHIGFSRDLRLIVAAIGALPKLNVFSAELRMPSFGLSVKSTHKWHETAHFTDKELDALLDAGPPPLQGLSINRCDISPEAVQRLAKACPKLQALELHCDVVRGRLDDETRGIQPNLPVPLSVLSSLTALAIGVIHCQSECQFATWCLPALRRLRLETAERPTTGELLALKDACLRLESLHLLWDEGRREVHVCPVDASTLQELQA